MTSIAPLTDSQRGQLLALARAAALGTARAGAPPPLPPLLGRLGLPGGAFVTLRLGGRLRGCIGVTASASPLAQVVRDMALKAATNDPRFPPISLEESTRADLTVEVSVLSSPMPPPSALPDGVEVGRHGLVVSGRGRRGLLLPQVASDHGWTSAEFLGQVCVKAGLPTHAWRDHDTAVQVFVAEVF